ncbi:MAG: Hsp20/alpha crystallin family protein [bacterium]
MKKKPSFFERLTGSVNVEDDDFEINEPATEVLPDKLNESWMDDSEGQLAVDVHQGDDAVIVKTMTAGVDPSDIEITVSRDTITIRGKRESEHEIHDSDYFHKELYWGSFSRTIMLPCEVESEEASAREDHGLLTITLPKIDKNKQTKVKIK